MLRQIRRYQEWLHGRWPHQSVEKLPIIDEHGQTNLPGVYIAGDLSGIPLLKFAADSGARIVQEEIWGSQDFQRQREASHNLSDVSCDQDIYDLVIIGCGVAGSSAALEAQKLDLNFVIYEAAEPYATLKDFPVNKPIFTYPSSHEPRGSLDVSYGYKETLVQGLDQQLSDAGVHVTRGRIRRVERQGALIKCHHDKETDAPPPTYALRVIIAIGRSGDFRRLGVPGEERGKVTPRLHDPKHYTGQQALVVGGGDSAV